MDGFKHSTLYYIKPDGYWHFHDMDAECNMQCMFFKFLKDTPAPKTAEAVERVFTATMEELGKAFRFPKLTPEAQQRAQEAFAAVKKEFTGPYEESSPGCGTMPESVMKFNGGVRCDTYDGPCACGAWHHLARCESCGYDDSLHHPRCKEAKWK